MARKPRSGRGSSRTPVTIDLDAKRVDDKAAETAGEKPGQPTHVPKPEPVAMSSIERNVSALGQAKTDGDAVKGQTGGSAAASATSAPKATEAGAKSEEAKPAPKSAPKPEEPSRVNPRPTSATPPSNRKGGGAGAVGAGVLGGIVALLGGAGLQWAGVLPSFDRAQPAIEAPSVDLQPLEDRINALQDELRTISETAANANTEAVASAANEQAAAIQSNVDALQAQLEQLQGAMASGNAGEGLGLEAINGRVDSVEQTVGAVQSRLDQVATAVEGLGDNDSAAAINAVETTVNDLQVSVETIRGDVQSLQSETEARLTELQARVEQNAKTLAESDAGETVARAVAAAGLKTAIDRGSPFMAELETFASVGGSEETVSTLRNYAASGVPTVTQLVEQFQPVARQIVATGDGVGADASITDRLMSSARSLVQVRPVGEVEGDRPGAIAARMEERLKAGNIPAALAEWESLPEAAKAQTQSFADTLRARETVDQMVSQLLNRAMAQTTDGAAPVEDAAPAQSQ